ncbi:MAG: class I SAM-dependent methyltransferase [Planctomycetota bacterium]|jgi:SAM-dependent methyltransferase
MGPDSPEPPRDLRARARQLAEEHAAGPRPDGWFETFYAESERSGSEVFWADRVPNPNLVPRWERCATEFGPHPRVLVVGAGFGDDAAWLAERGARVTAFDVSPRAVARARERFAELDVRWFAGDLFRLPFGSAAHFDCVVETYTLQVLRPGRRGAALEPLANCVRPGGQLWVIARGRDPEDPVGELPWPLLRSELAPLADLGLCELSFEDYDDDEDPPLRRFVARYRREAP